MRRSEILALVVLALALAGLLQPASTTTVCQPGAYVQDGACVQILSGEKPSQEADSPGDAGTGDAGLPEGESEGEPEPPEQSSSDRCACRNGQVRSCYSGASGTSGVGICRPGQQTCSNCAFVGPCVGEVVPGTETCANGKDDDCDGQIDETPPCACQPGSTKPCYGGPQGTSGVGSCRAGLQTCLSSQKWGGCVGEVLPATETCNGKDDDCDGTRDEDHPGGGKPCVVPGKQGICSAGVGACDQGKVSCKQAVQPHPKGEQCANGRDDDCDGDVDESPPCTCKAGTTQSCYGGAAGTVGKGICKAGKQTCGKDQTWGPCLGQQMPGTESCNGKDDDCNGKPDDLPDLGGACSDPNRKGVCRPGTFVCVANAKVCKQTILQTAELCNGKDDDCDGTVDEGFAAKGRACTVTGKLGPCAQGSYTACTKGKLVCTGPSPGKEICNGKDDDCDGKADQTFPELGKACTVKGALGPCAVGKYTSCAGGKLVCTGPSPGTETCNGKDDDCDGKPDNIVDLGKPCSDPKRKGICRAGTWACVANSKTCRQSVTSGTETCNGKDDDCDGQTDEGGVCAAEEPGIADGGPKDAPPDTGPTPKPLLYDERVLGTEGKLGAKAWAAAKGAYVFFGHQSVGRNILDGVSDIGSANAAYKFRVVAVTGAAGFSQPGIGHASVGYNYDPYSKISSFNTFLTTKGLGQKVALALFKFCYVDLMVGTDTIAVLNKYTSTMASLQTRFPSLKLAYVTAPLMTGADAANAVRNDYNGKLRTYCHARGKLLYDLASVEASLPDGSRCRYTLGGKTYERLCSQYTGDGGHLNQVGRQRAAGVLLIMLASLLGP